MLNQMNLNQNLLQLKVQKMILIEKIKPSKGITLIIQISTEERIHTETKENNIETIIRILWLMI